MTTEQKQVFMARVEALVSKPGKANAMIRTGSFDLEMIIRVAKEDEHVFSEEVLATLKKELADMTGVFSPVVYLEGKMPEELQHYLGSTLL